MTPGYRSPYGASCIHDERAGQNEERIGMIGSNAIGCRLTESVSRTRLALPRTARAGGDEEEAVRGRLVVVVAVSLKKKLIALAVGCSSGSPEASVSRAPNLHGKILFIREGEYNGKLTVFTAAADGTNVRQLSDFGENPRFSPDGTEVAMAGPPRKARGSR